MSRQGGFTLIEMVLVIIILSVASVPLFGLFSRASLSLLDNESIQTAAQLAQERAEFLLAVRRSRGFNDPVVSTNTSETFTAPYANFSRDTVITQPPAGPGCPLAATCKEVVISVLEGGSTRAAVTFLLVDY